MNFGEKVLDTFVLVLRGVATYWLIQFVVLVLLAYALANAQLYSFAALVGAGAVILWKSLGSHA